MEVWIYLDETSIGSWRGAGAMVIPNPMPHIAVDQALEALARDDDEKGEAVQKMDQRTLSRGYFHACEDSANAHSYWTNALNRHFNGVFIYSIREDDGRGDAEAFFEHLSTTLLSSLPRRSRVHALFERRNGFGPDAAGELVSELYRRLDWVAYELPQVNIHYPCVEASIGTKVDPGLQAVDFLLWATLQKLVNPGSKKAVWRDRINMRWTADCPDAGEGTRYGQFWGRLCTSALALGGRGVYESEAIQRPLPPLGVMELYWRVETAVRRAARTEFPVHAKHLSPFVQDVVRTILGKPTREDIKNVARAFLRLFDTLPLHTDSQNAPEFEELYDAKRFAALMIREAKNGDRDLLDRILAGREERVV